MKKLLTILTVILLGYSSLYAQQKGTLKLVTPQMSQKMYRTIKAYPHVTQLMYHLLKATSTLDGELKIEAIAEHPDSAKNALNLLCEFLEDQGGEDYLDANLLQSFYFTAKEAQLAKAIYGDYRSQKIALRNQQELEAETNLLNRWKVNGPDHFLYNTKKSELTNPDIETEFSEVIAYIDSLTALPSRNLDSPLATIEFTITETGSIEDFNSTGRFGEAFSAENFIIESPMLYQFTQLDTIVPVVCRMNFPVREQIDRIKRIEIEVKYDKKKDVWKISSYDPKKTLDSVYLPIITRFLEAIPEDHAYRKGKKSFEVSISKHWLEILGEKYPLSQQCAIIEELDNKSAIQRLGEKHLDW